MKGPKLAEISGEEAQPSSTGLPVSADVVGAHLRRKVTKSFWGVALPSLFTCLTILVIPFWCGFLFFSCPFQTSSDGSFLYIWIVLFTITCLAAAWYCWKIVNSPDNPTAMPRGFLPPNEANEQPADPNIIALDQPSPHDQLSDQSFITEPNDKGYST